MSNGLSYLRFRPETRGTENNDEVFINISELSTQFLEDFYGSLSIMKTHNYQDKKMQYKIMKMIKEEIDSRAASISDEPQTEVAVQKVLNYVKQLKTRNDDIAPWLVKNYKIEELKKMLEYLCTNFKDENPYSTNYIIYQQIYQQIYGAIKRYEMIEMKLKNKEKNSEQETRDDD